MGLKPPPGARSWRRRSREGEGDDCRFSLPLNWAVGERERAQLPGYPELSPTSYGRHTVGPGNQHRWLMIYNFQAEEFQAMNKHGSKAVGFLDQDVRCRHSQTVQSRGWLHRQRPPSSGFSPTEPSRSLHPRGHGTPRGALLPRQWSGAKFFFILCQKPASKWLLSSSILPSSPQPGAALATSAPFLLGQTQSSSRGVCCITAVCPSTLTPLRGPSTQPAPSWTSPQVRLEQCPAQWEAHVPSFQPWTCRSILHPMGWGGTFGGKDPGDTHKEWKILS